MDQIKQIKGLLTWSAAFLRPHHHVPLNHVKTLHSRHSLNAAEQKLISHRPVQKYVSPDNIAAPIRSALKEVKRWKDVVIRPFDKGVGFFFLERMIISNE